MDFSLTDEQLALQKTTKDFVCAEIIPVASEYDRKGEFPWPIVKKAFETGLVYAGVPEEYGGGGLSGVDQLIMGEELAAGCAGISTSIAINNLAAIPLVLAGNHEQKKKFLNVACEDEKLMAFCVTEPGIGSDVSSMSTTIKRIGGDYIINGTKTFITNGGVADYYVLFGATDKSKGTKGITALVVPRDSVGVSVGKKEEKMGQCASNTTEVIFDDVTVPEFNRLGKEGDGFKIIMGTFNLSRPGVASSAVGVARCAMENALDYAVTREQFGVPIALHQAIMFIMADMSKDISAGRLLAWHAAWKADQGQDNSKEAAMAKAFCGDMVMRVTTDAVQVLGGYGYIKDYPLEKLMRDAKVFQIYEGTSQIQRILIGRSLLKDKL